MALGDGSRCVVQLLLLVLLCRSACAEPQGVSAQGTTMYDALKQNPAHRLLMLAIDEDKDGSLKELLQKRDEPITALVPNTAALVSAGLKFGLVKSVADMKGLMQNSCLVNALLKQHVISGRYTYKQLGKELFKPSFLMTNRWDKKEKKMTKVNWPILLHHDGPNSPITVSSAAWDPDTNEPIVNGTIVQPYDVRIGSGIMHTINKLLVPTSNLTQLLEITGCAPPAS